MTGGRFPEAPLQGRGERVLVAMSGGVDSSVAAAVLKDGGFEVVGATMQIWPTSLPVGNREGGCCSLAAVEDARRVASILGIPYYVLNFQEYFEREVVTHFAREYLRGRTPNPCIRCNQRIKFGRLLHKAKELGAAYVATGHYARIRLRPDTGRYMLVKARDTRKDQTYVLYTMSQGELSRTLFPIGDFTKEHTREVATRLGLPVAKKPESQEICFIPDDDYRGFLREYLPESRRPGPIIDLDGRLLGEHEGIAFYTVGQRKGLGISSREPLYVVRLDSALNAVVVGRARDVFAPGLVAADLNWIPFDSLEMATRAEVRIRYNTTAVPGRIVPRGPAEVEVHFDSPQRAVTPGQACVFYDGDIVIGGGIIQRRED